MGYDIHPGTVMRSCIDSVTAVHQVYSSMQVRIHMYYIKKRKQAILRKKHPYNCFAMTMY